jgi:hypothetical protein
MSYNAMPGWAADLPIQRLLFTFGRGLPGDAYERLTSASAAIKSIIAAGAPSLAASPIASNLDALVAEHPPAYLAHEYMTAHWQPMFGTEVRSAMAELGLAPAGSAWPLSNFDGFVLQRAEVEALSTIDDPDLRELARDFVMHTRFRRDVFSRGGTDLDEEAQRVRLLAMRYALAQP